MENIAYLHLAFAYEDSKPSELVSLSALFKKTATPDWRRLSSGAWKYMLPLALTLSLFSSFSSVFALEKGDQGPSVKNLQQKLQAAGFYQAPITQVYDLSTEDAVRKFQKAAGLSADGKVGIETGQKIESWQTTVATQLETPNTTTQQINTNISATTQTPKIPTFSSVTNKRKNPNLLTKGDEGEDVRILQERLQVAGFYYGNPTGIFGPITEEAVKRFQQAYKLNVDGVVGSGTLAKLPPVEGNGKETSQKAVNRDELSLGDRGEIVRILQKYLIKTGYLKGQPNGYYGSQTADAVSRFQKNNHLEINGIAGTTTRAKLHSLGKTSAKSDFSILEIQTRLQERGFYKGQLNGMMAEDTKKAIKRAQEFYGVTFSDLKSGSF